MKKLNAWLHLWLGLFSGIIVLIVSITGCIYVFEKEISGLYEPWRYVQPQAKAYLSPSQLSSAAEKSMGGKKVTAVTYKQRDESAIVASYDRKAGIYTAISVNPYTGEVLNAKTTSRHGGGEFNFFTFILNGHRALWLPYTIGRPIVGVGVLVFVVLLITGLILWWPKKWSRTNINKSFKIKFRGSFKRVNYDTHNVLGFYGMLFLLIVAMTGLVWSFQWFSKSLYWVTSGGKSMTEFSAMQSDTTIIKDFQMASVDKVWAAVSKETNEGMYISVPQKPADVIGATLYLRAGTYYKTNNYYYDQKTLKPLKASGPYAGRYEDANMADKLRRMNYDIHIGAILGIPGKIIAFIISLISASLPVTGFLIWWGKKKKSKKKAKGKTESSAGLTGRDSAVRRVPPVKRKQVAAVTETVVD